MNITKFGNHVNNVKLGRNLYSNGEISSNKSFSRKKDADSALLEGLVTFCTRPTDLDDVEFAANSSADSNTKDSGSFLVAWDFELSEAGCMSLDGLGYLLVHREQLDEADHTGLPGRNHNQE